MFQRRETWFIAIGMITAVLGCATQGVKDQRHAGARDRLQG